MERTRPNEQTLGPDESQQILRRAAELDRKHAAPAGLIDKDEPRHDAAELQRIAAESGLSKESLRRALDELNGGALARSVSRKAEPGVATGVFSEPPELVEKRLAAALVREGLARANRTAHATQWRPAAGIGNAVARAFDLGGRGAWLGATVESSVYAVPGERSSAELRGQVKDIRAPVATVAGLLLGFPAVIALLVFLAVGLSEGNAGAHGAGMLVVTALWAVLTALISRGVSRGRVRKLQRALERTLSQIAGPSARPS